MSADDQRRAADLSEYRTTVPAMVDLAKEADRATEMLKGRSVRVVHRHREKELAIEFEDGTRLFVDSQTALELSITGDFAE